MSQNRPKKLNKQFTGTTIKPLGNIMPISKRKFSVLPLFFSAMLIASVSFASSQNRFYYNQDIGKCENSQHEMGLNAIDLEDFARTGNGECGDFHDMHIFSGQIPQNGQNSNLKGADLGTSFPANFSSPDLRGANMTRMTLIYALITNGLVDSHTQLTGFPQTYWAKSCHPVNNRINCGLSRR